MKYFFYGNFEVKINDKISEIIKKNNFSKIEFSLNTENLEEILAGLFSLSLFNEKNLFVIDITNTKSEEIEKFFSLLKGEFDIAIYYRDDLPKTSKILKFLPKDFTILEFKKGSEGNVFNLSDSLISKDIKKSYLELKKLNENEVAVFNGVLSSFRGLFGLKFELYTKDKIVPFKIGLYKKAVENFDKEELKNIYNNFYYNDLKFKKGEITDEMLLLHTVNLFFLDQNANTKQK
jgi:DNA polymerase III delta subunit